MIFQKKYISCYILLTDQISLSDCLYFLRYWAICVLQLLANQAVTTKNLKPVFLIKPFWYMTKKSRQKLKNLENGKSFWGEIKSFFIIFKELSVAKSCLRPYSAPLGLFEKLGLNTQLVLICPKSGIETLEQVVRYVPNPYY